MANSQNGWSVVSSTGTEVVSAGGRDFRVRRGDVAKVFRVFVERYAAEVEPIRGGIFDDWSYAVRDVRGSSTAISNHSSGTAIDLNAVDHARGARGTYARTQLASLRRLLRDFPVLRWGGDYSTVPDEMHFEINTSAASLAAFARTLEDDMFNEQDRQGLVALTKKVEALEGRLVRIETIVQESRNRIMGVIPETIQKLREALR